MRPSPVAVARIAAWTNRLMDRGVALAGVGSGHAARAGDVDGGASAMGGLPYRPNVGAVLFIATAGAGGAANRRTPRARPAGWQLPQGGIDEGENPREAVLRELAEEIGTDRAEVIRRLTRG